MYALLIDWRTCVVKHFKLVKKIFLNASDRNRDKYGYESADKKS